MSAAERVSAGAALLDEQRPGWWRGINLDSLVMMLCDRCILGQLYGDYEDGALDLGLDERDCIACGFNATGHDEEHDYHADMTDYPLLAAAWRDLITARRETP